MLRYILLRGALALAVALTVSLAAFLLLSMATDTASAIAGEDATPEVVETIRALRPRPPATRPLRRMAGRHRAGRLRRQLLLAQARGRAGR